MPKVVLVTGCSSGVGLHTAVQLAQSGAKVYASMRDLKKRAALDAAASAAGVKVEVLRLDVEDVACVEGAVRQIIAASGRIDVLVNNAGAGKLKALEEMTAGEMRATFDSNFFGAVHCIRAVLPHMRQAKTGHILAVSSVGGLVGQPLNELYCAAKFALEGLMESLATYLEPFFGIKCTLVEPAGIKSDFVKNVMDTRAPTDAAVEQAYAPVLKSFWEAINSRGSFEDAAQTSEQVAAVIVGAINKPTPALRILTSPVAKAFTAEKSGGDPDGLLLQTKIRAATLGIAAKTP